MEWLGEVPSHWRLSKLKYLATFSGGGTPSRDKPEYWGGSIPWVSPKDMKAEVVLDAQEHITDAGLASSATNLVEAGAVLIVVRSGILQHTIPVALTAVPVALNQDMKALRFDNSCKPSFFARWVQGLNNQLLLVWMKQGATVESIEHSYLADTLVPLPPEAEQAAIAAFLDRETAKIDALVEEQRRLVELLKEKRQAVIYHAVTKGLDPSVPMKDSGVEWLGEVPAHWATCGLGFRYDVSLGKMLDEKRETGKLLGPYLRNTDVQWGKINIENLPEMDFSGDEIVRYRLVYGDLMVCEGGEVGRAAIWQGDLDRCFYQKALHRLRPHRPASDFPGFMYYILSAAAGLGVFSSATSKATISHLPADSFRKYRFGFPPLSDQIKIANYLDQQTFKIDALVAEALTAELLLQERRSALISAAVTGKIDVRGLTPTPSQVEVA